VAGGRVIRTLGLVLGFAVLFAAGVALAVVGVIAFVIAALLGGLLILASTRNGHGGRRGATEGEGRAEVLAWWHDEQRRPGGRGQ
jgi:hypothetical protein